MLGSILVKGNDAISSLLVIVFSLDALMLYTMFYQSRLVPGRISGFGIVVISLMMTACVLPLFCGNRITRYIPLAAPIAMQEMVLAVWLIVKRFSTPVMTSTSRKTETSELLSAV